MKNTVRSGKLTYDLPTKIKVKFDMLGDEKLNDEAVERAIIQLEASLTYLRMQNVYVRKIEVEDLLSDAEYVSKILKFDALKGGAQCQKSTS